MLSQLLRKGNDLLRFKGVLVVRGSDKKLSSFSRSPHAFDGAFSKEHAWEPNEKRANKFIFIGKNLDRGDLTRRFDSCVFKENEALQLDETNDEQGGDGTHFQRRDRSDSYLAPRAYLTSGWNEARSDG
jgi:hypothetical protein